jgi:hypothetical protein
MTNCNDEQKGIVKNLIQNNKERQREKDNKQSGWEGQTPLKFGCVA